MEMYIKDILVCENILLEYLVLIACFVICFE